MRIDLEQSYRLRPEDELTLLRAAHARTASPAIRSRLAALLNREEAFVEVVALLLDARDKRHDEELILADALFASGERDNDCRALDAATRAVAIAADPERKAAALSVAARARIRLGDEEGARQMLSEALRLDPLAGNAFKRMAKLILAARGPEALLALVERTAAQGASHAALFAARTMARTLCGEHEAAGYDLVERTEMLAQRPGWTSSSALNGAITGELLACPDRRFDGQGAASRQTWRIDGVEEGAVPSLRPLLDGIVVAIRRYLDETADLDHPWIRARPAVATIRCSCLITEGDGYEDWHMHPAAWLSGVYYVQVPEPVASGTTTAGCLAFGLPPDMVGEDAAARYGIRLLRPQAGQLTLFPSHHYHRTFPHGLRDTRICLAFDLVPR